MEQTAGISRQTGVENDWRVMIWAHFLAPVM